MEEFKSDEKFKELLEDALDNPEDLLQILFLSTKLAEVLNDNNIPLRLGRITLNCFAYSVSKSGWSTSQTSETKPSKEKWH